MLQWLKKIVPEPRVPEIGGSSPGCTETAATRARRPAPQNPRSPSSRFAPHSLGHKRHDERGEFPGWAGDTLSRSGRTLLPFDPGLPQECPPLAGMSPECDRTLQLLLAAQVPVEAGEEVARVVRAGGCLRVVLDGEAAHRGDGEPLDGPVVQVHVGDAGGGAQGAGIDRKVVVLAGDCLLY